MDGSTNGRLLNDIRYWDIGDAEWYALGNSVNGPVYAMAINGNDVYLGGSFNSAGGVKSHGIARWNQVTHEWSSVGSGISGGTGLTIAGCRPVVYAIIYDGYDVYVGGNFTQAGGVPANSIARRDPTAGTWNAIEKGVTCTGLGCSAYVRVIYPSTYFGYIVGGSFDYGGGSLNPANNIAIWYASHWYSVGNGTNGIVFAIQNPDSFYADIGGSFTSPGFYAAIWDGTSWSPMGASLNNSVHAMTLLQGTWPVIGGSFTNAVGNPTANYIAKYTEGSWVPVGAGLNDVVLALDWAGNTLNAGGSFAASGITGINRIAQWKSNTRSGFGSGVNNTVQSIASSNLYMYIGGSFRRWQTLDLLRALRHGI